MFKQIFFDFDEPIRVDCDECNYSSTVPFAFCEETDRLISIDCSLSYTTNAYGKPLTPWFHEFEFKITISDLNDLTSHSTQDRNVVRRYLPPDSIPFVMPVVLESCRTLIQRVRPRVLFRVTKMRGPNAGAMAKHNLITELLREMGYSIFETGTDPFQRPFWVMALVE